MGSEYFFIENFKKLNSKKQIFINLRQRYKEKKNPTKNEKEFERERERDNIFLYGKNIHRMGESDKFIVK